MEFGSVSYIMVGLAPDTGLSPITFKVLMFTTDNVRYTFCDASSSLIKDFSY